MLCTDCNRDLSPISVTGHGRKIDLDYCGHCGGIWTDNGETNFLDQKSLEQLEDLLPEQPAPDVLVQEYLCPKDRSIISIFRGESIPYDLSVFKCNKCGGFWFPFHSLSRFKAAQAAKINYYKKWKIPLPSVYAIALPVLILMLLGAGLLAVLSGVNKNTDTRIRAHAPVSKPLVIHIEGNSVIISFNTDTAVTSKIKYWIRPNNITESWVSNIPKTNHTIQLKNLNPGASYSYELVIPDMPRTQSPTYSFSVIR